MGRHAKGHAPWVVMIACLGTAGPALASRGAETLLEGAKFVKAFSEQVADYYDQQLQPLERERDRLTGQRNGAEPAEQERLGQEIEGLNRRIADIGERKRLAAGGELAWDVFDALAATHETISEIEDGLEQTDTWDRQIVWLDRAAGYELAEAREKIDQANQIADYVGKLRALSEALEDADEAAPNPRIKGMITGLFVLFRAFEEFGESVPVLGDFVEKYGEVGQALAGAAARLDTRLQGRSQGLLVPGYRDDGRVAAFDAQFGEWVADRDPQEIAPLRGVRDAYKWPDGGVLLWDPAAGRWLSREDITPADLLRRYTFFATYGNVSPTPDEVLGAQPESLIGLYIKAFPVIVAPAGKVTCMVAAECLDGSRPEVTLSVRSGAVTYRAGGPGELEPSIVGLGEPVRWTAPDVSNSIYRISVSLFEERRYTQVGEAFVDVATGSRTELRLKAEPPSVKPGDDGDVAFEVLGADGVVLPRKGTVWAESSEGLELGTPSWLYETQARGAVPFTAREPGEYVVQVRFSGYIDAGWLFAENAMPCVAETTITVEGAGARTQPVADQPPGGEVPPPPPAAGEEVEYFEIDPPTYLVHLTETMTVNGWRAIDAWYLHPQKPEPDGSLLIADGGGGNIPNKADQHQGPFTNSRQVCAALRALGMDTVLWSDGRVFSCQPQRR